jgi:hypothetical protein
VETTRPAYGRGAATADARPRKVASPTAPIATTVFTPRPAQETGGRVPWRLVVVVLLVGGGAGVYVMRARKVLQRPRFSAAPSIPAVKEPEPRYESARPRRESPLAARARSGRHPERADLLRTAREVPGAVQRRPGRGDQRVDGADAAGAAARHRAQNLQLLAGSLYDRVRALMVARYGSAMKTLRNAALLMPSGGCSVAAVCC